MIPLRYHALIIPAGGGKTTLATNQSFFDIDDLFDSQQTIQADTLRNSAQWDYLNTMYSKALSQEHWCATVLAHTPQQLPTGWTYDILLPSAELHASNIALRDPVHKALSQRNYQELLKQKHTVYDTHDALAAAAQSAARAGTLWHQTSPLACAGCSVHTNARILQAEAAASRCAPALLRAWLQEAAEPVISQGLDGWSDTLAIGKQLQANTSGLGRAKTRVTLATLDGVSPLTRDEKRFVLANVHLEEHTVVSWLVWARVADRKGAMIAEPAARLLLLDQLGWCKPLLDSLRLLGDDASAEDIALLLLLRKMQSLSGRDLGEADWAAEQAASTNWYSMRERVVSATDYRSMFMKAATTVAQTTIRATYGARLPTMHQWWQKRVISTPKGSSSQRHSVDKHKTSLHDKSDRANKRVVFAYRSADEPERVLALTPHCIARCSTKPEPGRKRRALYAACDCSVIAASWASYGLESAMRWGGMVARQTPADVHEWLGDHLQSQQVGGTWLSLDYSDFNKEHRVWELVALNEALAAAWDDHPQLDIRADKVRAALWTAKSHTMRWATTASKTWIPLSGLFSGHRDTARDNTMLHKIYQLMQLQVAQALTGNDPGLVKSYMCGDDEDTWFARRDNAMVYYGVGAAIGWHFNPRKQMLSRTHHEFLQIMCSGQDGPTQPLIPNVVAFVDGNWYKDPLIDPASMAESMMRVGVELVNRGADASTVIPLVQRSITLWYKWAFQHHVRWDALLSKRVLAHPALEMAAPPGRPTKDTPPDQRVESALNRLNPPGMQAVHELWWPLLSQLKPGVARSVMNTVRHDAFRGWFMTAWNRRPPRPVIPAGKVPPISAAAVPTTTAQAAWDTGLHRLALEESITPQKLAAMIGIPLALLNALDLQALNALGTPQVAGYIATVEQDDEHPLVQKIQGTTQSSLAWLN